MWGKITAGLLVTGGLAYSCSETPESIKAKEEKHEKIQKIHAAAKQRAMDLLQNSCPSNTSGKYMQLKPLVQGAEIKDGTEMLVLYFDMFNNPVYPTIRYNFMTTGPDYNKPEYYRIDPNQLTLTETYTYQKNKRTRDVLDMPILPTTIKFQESYRKCITNLKG